MLKDLAKLGEMVHSVAVEVGWWDATQFRNEELKFWAIDEMVEVGNSNPNVPDKNLPDRSSMIVEIADVCIICLDLYGHHEYGDRSFEYQTRLQELAVSRSATKYVNSPKTYIMYAMQRALSRTYLDEFVVEVLACMSFMAVYYGYFDLEQVITEKVAFNAKRADHKARIAQRGGA